MQPLTYSWVMNTFALPSAPTASTGTVGPKAASTLRRLLLGALAAAALSGCAGTHLAKPAEPRNGAQITSAAIAFDESALSYLPIRVSKAAAGYGYTPPPPSISAQDRAQAMARAKAVIDAYRTHAPQKLQAALAENGAPHGFQTEIVVKPVALSIDANNGSVSVAMEVTVKQRDVAPSWKIVPVTNNMADGAYWNIARAPGIGDTPDVDLTKLVDSFVSSTVREMRMAGWFR